MLPWWRSQGSIQNRQRSAGKRDQGCCTDTSTGLSREDHSIQMHFPHSLGADMSPHDWPALDQKSAGRLTFHSHDTHYTLPNPTREWHLPSLSWRFCGNTRSPCWCRDFLLCSPISSLMTSSTSWTVLSALGSEFSHTCFASLPIIPSLRRIL